MEKGPIYVIIQIYHGGHFESIDSLGEPVYMALVKKLKKRNELHAHPKISTYITKYW